MLPIDTKIIKWITNLFNRLHYKSHEKLQKKKTKQYIKSMKIYKPIKMLN